MRTADDPLIGRILADRYVMEACIGEGGMGRVYRAQHKRIGRRFAIKVLFGDWTTNQTVVSRFAREAAAAGRVHHRSLVPVVDFGEAEDGLLYLAMDYVDGENLNHVLEREGPLVRERVIRLMIQLCQGLAHAHGKGLVHRDFKTDNILVGRDDDGECARITDFGIAMLTETGDAADRLTTQGAVVGTPAYMSPEQATGDPMDHRTDLFSLGLVMYEMLAGVLPFEGSPMGILRCNMAVPPPAIAERVPGLRVDPALEALAFALMAKDPDDRPSDANIVIQRLEALPAEWSWAPSALSFEPAASTVSLAPPVRRPVATAELAYQPTLAEQATVVVLPGAGEPVEHPPERSSGRRRRGLVWFTLATAAAAAVYFAVVRPSQNSSPAGGRSSVAAENVALVGVAKGTPAAAASTSADTPEWVAVDAGAGSPADAAVGGARTAKPRSKGKRDKPHSRRGKDKPKSGSGDTSAGDADQSKGEIPAKAVTERYKAAGRALEKLHKTAGEEVSAPLRKRYFAVPYVDSLRDPALRASTDATLRQLQRDIDRVMP